MNIHKKEDYRMSNLDDYSLIYVGSHYPPELKEEFKRAKAFIDYPGDILQQAILKGIDKNGIKVRSLSKLKIAHYPFYKKLYFNHLQFSHSNDGLSTDTYIGCINFPILNRISYFIRMAYYIRMFSKKNKPKRNILVYGLSSPVLLALWLNRKRLGQTTIIIADLPEYMSDNKKLSYRVGKAIDHHLINYLLRHTIDKFVLLSPHMCERLPINGKPWIQMEGIFDRDNRITCDVKDGHKTILYSGNLNRRYGILDLLYAFELIKQPEYRLLFCGSGNTVDEIKRIAENDTRVQYLGILPRERVLQLQQQATLLVNPRHRQETYTRYSFPSKTMEYMASGTPTLMSHLDSIPQEYDSHLFYFDDESIEGMSKKIVEICSNSTEYLKEFGRKASDFILLQKNPKTQIRKVLTFINK